MTPSIAATLGGLALVDSTSFGTLGIPLWLMLRPRLSLRTFVLFLATICVFYWGLGLVLTLGAATVAGLVAGLDLPDLSHAQLAVGVALFAVSFLFDNKQHERRRARRRARVEAGGARLSRHERWKARLEEGNVPAVAVMAVALGAGLVEAASMLPYLGAVGLITQARLSPAATALTLAGYVAVMALPALLLLGLRVVARPLVEPVLTRLNTWIERNSGEMLGWILGIVGFLLAADAAGRVFGA